MKIILITLLLFSSSLSAHLYKLKCDPEGHRGRFLICDKSENATALEVGEGAPLFNPLALKPGLYNGFLLVNGRPMDSGRVYLFINRDLPAGFLVAGYKKAENLIWIDLVQLDPSVSLRYKYFSKITTPAKRIDTLLYLPAKQVSFEMRKKDKTLLSLMFYVDVIALNVLIGEPEKEFQESPVEVPPQPQQAEMSQTLMGSVMGSLNSWFGSSSSRLTSEESMTRRDEIRFLLQQDALFGLVGWDVGNRAPHHVKYSDNLLKITFGFDETEALVFAFGDRNATDGVTVNFKTKLTARSPLSKARFYIKDNDGQIVEFLSPYFEEKKIDLKVAPEFFEHEIILQQEAGKQYKLYFVNDPETNESVTLEIKDFTVERQY